MTSTDGERNRFALVRKDLLRDYAKISGTRPGAALATAMRVQSRQYFDILAMQASRGRYDWQELRHLLVAGSLDTFIPGPLAEMGRYLLLQARDSSDRLEGAKALEVALDSLPAKQANLKFRKLLVEHHIVAERREQALELLARWPDVDSEGDGYLRAELDNPNNFAGGDESAWLANFNRWFASSGLWPIAVNPGEEEAFDRVVCQIPDDRQRATESDAPLVSVVVPTYRPERQELMTAVRSILAQTLSDLEVIIVDDASGDSYRSTLEEAAALDSRVRLVHAPRNAGAYAARNIGYGAARGEFVTGQDDDDWSHPERLERQVAFLRENPEASGCRVWAVTCLPNLSRVRLGYKFRSPNASSLMMSTDSFRQVGGFIEARKGADTELHLRLERVTGRSVMDLELPLTLVRITPQSLSRSEFRAGWSHPARRYFKSSYRHWHAESPKAELALNPGSKPRVRIPRRFMVDIEAAPKHYDVVLAGSWGQLGGPQKSMLEEVRSLVDRGFRVGIMDLEAARFMNTAPKDLNWPVQDLINRGVVDQVLLDDDVTADLLIVRYPPILQFIPDERAALNVSRVIILANQAPSERDGTDIRYLVRDCQTNAERLFGTSVTWAPQGPQVREAIAPYLSDDELESFDIVGVLNTRDWPAVRRRRKRSVVPVIGRHSRDDAMKWPETMDILKAVYPTTGQMDVRVMGGAKTPSRTLGGTPPGWVVYRPNAMAVPDFLDSLDFFVFYQHSQAIEAFGRAILEAIAAGPLVVLPPHYEPVFGEAALYAEPRDVQALVMRLHRNRELYEEKRRIARAVFEERFSHEAYAALIDSILKSDSREGDQ